MGNRERSYSLGSWSGVGDKDQGSGRLAFCWVGDEVSRSLWCSRRLLRVPWTARKSNQSILKEIKFSGRTDAEAEAPIFWLPYAKN